MAEQSGDHQGIDQGVNEQFWGQTVELFGRLLGARVHNYVLLLEGITDVTIQSSLEIRLLCVEVVY